MQCQNVKEYEGIRSELTTLRNCVTLYVGFVVSGSAAAFWGLVARTDDKVHIGLAALLLAIVSVFILFLLSYKFTSHNRYAGYTKLLTQESFGQNCGLECDLFCWEICLDRLRESDCERHGLTRECSDCRILGLEDIASHVVPISGIKPSKDKGSFWRGWILIGHAGKEASGSWKFPIYVVRIFAAIDLMFALFAVYFLVPPNGKRLIPPPLYLAVLLPLLLILWTVILSKLYKQMAGSETVEAFCWKFVPIRYHFLHEFDRGLNYEIKGLGRYISEQSKVTRQGRSAATSRT